MDFLTLKVSCSDEIREILLAELSFIGYDSFEETDIGITASTDNPEFDDLKNQSIAILERYDLKEDSYQFLQVPKVNWNKEWEKNFDPVNVADQVWIRAPFHEEKETFRYQININPKMSFGTGHHATTYLMVQALLDHNLSGKSVIDLGTGTGILMIMAHLLGAETIAGTDVDDWCIENSRENLLLNKIEEAELKKGPIATLAITEKYDFVLANINKNVLLSEMTHYQSLMKESSTLFLSGFYEKDEADMLEKIKGLGMKVIASSTKNDWMCMVIDQDH